MKETQKVFARLKHLPEDFVVEEIADKWLCSADWDVEQNISIPDKPESKDYLCFELVKRDIDHFIAVKTLSKQLKKSLKFISYAGSKDKKAVTSQRISVFQPNLDLVKQFSSDFIKLHNFSWSKRKIKLGYLEGNKFSITLRDIDKKDASKISSFIKKHSFFPNFFGKQRFGSVRKNNHLIGKLILKGQYEQAVMLILADTSVVEKPDIMKARKELAKTKDFKAALKYFPSNLKLERGILTSLSKKNDFLFALKRVEKRYSLLLVQAVQSLLFNEILKQALAENVNFNVDGQRNVPLFGYKSKFSQGRLGEIEREVLEKHNISLSDFDLRDISHLRLKGSFRRALVEAKGLDVDVSDDECFKPSRKIVLKFSLPSGVYATTFLDQFFVFV